MQRTGGRPARAWPHTGGCLDDTSKSLTHVIIGCAYAVHNALGVGFLEKVYENALRVEIESHSLAVRAQAPVAVLYRDHVVGEYYADLLVEGRVIVEIKAVARLLPEHETQLVNYLTATGIEHAC